MIYRGIANRFIIVNVTNDDIATLYNLLMDKTPVYVYFLVSDNTTYETFVRVVNILSMYEYKTRHIRNIKTRISIHVMTPRTRRWGNRRNRSLKWIRGLCNSMIKTYHLESSRWFDIGDERHGATGNRFSCVVDYYHRLHIRINDVEVMRDVGCHETDNSSKK